MLDVHADIPEPLARLAATADRLNAAVVVFDQKDTVRHASARFRSLYDFCGDFDGMSFDQIFRSAWKNSGNGPGCDDALTDTNHRREAERLEFKRASPTVLLCAHTRLPSGWSAQIRIEPGQPGFDHFFAYPPQVSLIEALKQRDAADMRAAALEAIGFPIAILTATGTLRFQNRAMGDLLAQRVGLYLADGALRLTDPLAEAHLLRLVADVAYGRACHSLGGKQVVTTICVGGVTYTASVSQCLSRLDDAAVLVIVPVVPDLSRITATLRQGFGLSPAQAQMAALVGTGTETSIAARVLDKSAHTAREQMKQIYKRLVARRIPASGQSTLTAWIVSMLAITGAVRAHGEIGEIKVGKVNVTEQS